MDAKTFFIVGGSSGIGLEIVNQLHKMGHIIYVGSRTLGKLAEVEGLRHIALDVTQQPVIHREALKRFEPDPYRGSKPLHPTQLASPRC